MFNFKHFHSISGSRKMKLKELKSLLQQLDTFEKSKFQLEQYSTPADIAAEALHAIDSYDGLEGVVADLGCGCGVLSIGAALLGAEFCWSVDVDDEALSICTANCEKLSISNIDFVQIDIVHLADSKWQKSVDMVIMNPPFGTKKRRGIDMVFLKTALHMARKFVYSMHKSSTREHIKKKAKDWRVDMEVVKTFKFKIPATYEFHKKNEVYIEVDFIRFSIPNVR